MRIDVKECARLLLEQDDILILTHAHPDGDTLGCGFALCRALLQKGKFAYVKNEADIPPKYNYLFDDIVPMKFTPRFVVAVDVATEGLLGAIQGMYHIPKFSFHNSKCDHSGTMSGINLFYAQFFQFSCYFYYFIHRNPKCIQSRKLHHMESSYDGIYFLSCKCVLHFSYNIGNTAMRAAIKYHKSLFCLKYDTLLMCEIICNEFIAHFAVHMCSAAHSIQIFCRMRHSPDYFFHFTYSM